MVTEQALASVVAILESANIVAQAHALRAAPGALWAAPPPAPAEPPLSPAPSPAQCCRVCARFRAAGPLSCARCLKGSTYKKGHDRADGAYAASCRKGRCPDGCAGRNE